MRQYFYEDKLEINQLVSLNDKIAHHLKDVLRYKNDDIIRLVDKDGNLFLASLVIENDVKALIREQISTLENNKEIILCPAMVKKEKWELILQKAAELGATKIVPIITNRTIIHLDEKEIIKKVERYNKIVLEACQQCNRLDIVTVEKPIKLKNIASYKSEVNLVAYEKENTSYITDFDLKKGVTIVFGPEGGFEEKEVELLSEMGFACCGLGKRILRAETASLYALSVIDSKRNEL